MAKYRLFIREIRHTIYEVEATSPEEGAKLCVTQPDKVHARLGVIEAHVDKWEEITAEDKTENKTQEAAQKYNPLDISHKMN